MKRYVEVTLIGETLMRNENSEQVAAITESTVIGTLTSAPYQMFFPIAAISLTMFSLNFIGDGLRDALDPKLKK